MFFKRECENTPKESMNLSHGALQDNRWDRGLGISRGVGEIFSVNAK